LTNSKIDIGDLIRLSGTFADLNGNLLDPTVVTLSIKESSGVVASFQYGRDAFVVRESVGKYYMDFAPNMEGLHTYRFAGSGAVTAAEEKMFYVYKRETA
jgi:hypothetical protein